MSEREKRGQAKQFKHQRDRAYEDSLKRDHLFSSKREFLTQKFRCSPVSSSAPFPLDIDAPVLLLVSGATIDVAFNNVIVGHIASDCDSIRAAVASEPRVGAMINAKVCRSPGLSGSFEIQINE